ncbi:MAG TPA: kelch repeat-containing protein, partial [Anaerolineae bacterium]|nr:kelch repeat-containing protein [Anaerolineae bacterium]
LRLLTTGATNREIARDLQISVNTVKVHLRNIYAKLNVASRTEATMVAVREGWIAVERGDEEAAAAAGPVAVVLPSLPRPERWPRVSTLRRTGLALACMVAIVLLFLPQALQVGANGERIDPIGALSPPVIANGVATNRWQTRAQMPTPRTGLAVVADGGLIYAIAGASSEGATSRVEVYDPQADAWARGSAKPTAVGYVKAAMLDGLLYVPGGFDAGEQPRDLLEVYDPAQDRWESRAPLPEALGAYGLAALDGALYLFGGRGERGYVDSAYRYDPQADAWQSIGQLSGKRGFVAAAALEGLIYVVGGYDGRAEVGTCEVYDPAAGAWSECAPLVRPRGGLELLAVRQHLYAVGGGMETYLAFNERYDPRLNAWARMETPVSGQWLGLGTAFVSPHIYAIGGWKGAPLSTNEAYQALYQLFP